MKNIVFTYPTAIENEHQYLIELFEKEIDFLHVRKENFSFGEMVAYINDIPNEFHNRIMMHDHYSLIGEFDLAGINLNRKSIGELVLEEEVDKCFIQPLVLTSKGIEVNRTLAKHVSYSAHNFKEIQNLFIQTDYVFLSPVFDSISKDGYKSAFTDLEELKRELSAINKSVVALGGIKSDKISLCEDLGFNGYARLGDVWMEKEKN